MGIPIVGGNKQFEEKLDFEKKKFEGGNIELIHGNKTRAGFSKKKHIKTFPFSKCMKFKNHRRGLKPDCKWNNDCGGTLVGAKERNAPRFFIFFFWKLYLHQNETNLICVLS